MGHRESALQLFPLFALHAKARGKRTVAKDGELDCGERDSGIYSRWLELLLVKRDIVDHLERQHEQACDERHDECDRRDFGIRTVPLDALLLLFADLLHEALDFHWVLPAVRALEYK